MKTREPDAGGRKAERIAWIALAAALAGVTFAVPVADRLSAPGPASARLKVFELTGVGSQGRWTLEPVSGFNYWWKTFPQAEIKVDPGDSVVIRLHSADVTHVFYAPTLRLGPVLIEPGHAELLSFRAAAAGTHTFYCMSVCGHCHFFMRGEIVVGAGGLPADSTAPPEAVCMHDLAPPAGGDAAAQGEYLFRSMGCIACHGEKGTGGIQNPNYARQTVPRLNLLYRTLSLEDEEECGRLQEIIEKGTVRPGGADLGAGRELRRLVFLKYLSVRSVIREGRIPARADTLSYRPPLAMPSWGARLSERDIDDILLYLLRHQAWEEL